MLLFAIPFAGLGTYMGYLALRDLWASHQMASWQIVPATIETAELEKRRSKNSYTYSAKAKYRYEFEGTSYSNNRVSLYPGSDNVGSFQEDTFRYLNDVRTRGEKVNCYVNPSNPSDSILNPEIRWGMISFYLIFAFTFGPIGYGTFFAALFWGRPSAETKKFVEQYPLQPWMHRADWHNRTVKNNSGVLAAVLCALAFFWNAITFPAVIVIPREVAKGNYGILFILLFFVIGLGFIYYAGRSVLQWRRFGRAVFKLHTLPAVPGANIKGDINLGAELPQGSSVKLILTATSSRTVSSQGKTKTVSEQAWSTEVNVTPSISGGIFGGAVIPVSISIPTHVPQTSVDNSEPRISWTLKAQADIPGVDLDTEFEVPVFKANTLKQT